MIRTRYCSATYVDQFKKDLTEKGHEVLEVTTVSGVAQVKFRVNAFAMDVFRQALDNLEEPLDWLELERIEDSLERLEMESLEEDDFHTGPGGISE
jgi:hypothetical protein